MMSDERNRSRDLPSPQVACDDVEDAARGERECEERLATGAAATSMAEQLSPDIRGRKLFIWAAAQLVVLAALFFAAWSHPPRLVEIDLAPLLTEGSEGGVRSGTLRLPAGSYTFHMDYVTASERTLKLTSDETKRDRYLNSGPVIVSPYAHSLSYDFDAKLPVDGFYIEVTSGEEGTISISGASLATNRQRYYRWIVLWLLFALAIDTYLLVFRRLAANRRRVCACVIGMAFLASLPLFTVGIHNGDDLPFHILRIDALAQELRRGVFPVRMESLWFYGYSYPPAILYGDFLLYPFALLRLAGFSMTGVFKSFMFFANLATAAIGYVSFYRCFRKRSLALLLDLLYLTASYRLVNVYTREAVGEYSAMIFLPLVAAGLWGIWGEERETRARRLDILALGGGMAGIVCCHNLSAEMTVITLVVAALLLWRRAFRPGALASTLSAVLVCLLLSAFYTVPFLDFYSQARIEVKEDFWQALLLGIQQNSSRVAEWFSFFHTPVHYRIGEASNRMMLTPGLLLMAALVLGVVAVCLKRSDGRIRFLCALTLIMLWMSSTLFPWDYVAAWSTLGRAMAQVQFAWRYIGCSLVPLTLLAGCLLEWYGREAEADPSLPAPGRAMWLLAAIACLMMFYFTSSFTDHAKIVSYRDTAEVDNIEPALDAEYVLTSSYDGTLYPLYRTEGLSRFEPVSREGYRFEVVAESQTGGWIDFPIFGYPYYAAWDGAGQRLETSLGDERRMLRVLLPPGFSGSLRVDFAAPWYWNAAWWVSVLAALLVLGWLAYGGFARKHHPD